MRTCHWCNRQYSDSGWVDSFAGHCSRRCQEQADRSYRAGIGNKESDARRGSSSRGDTYATIRGLLLLTVIGSIIAFLFAAVPITVPRFFRAENHRHSELDSGLGQAQERTQWDNETESVSQAPEGARAQPAAALVEDFRMSAGDRIFFDSDRADLSPEARSTVERQAAWLREHPRVTVLIMGNTDQRENSVDLGLARAAAMRDYLVSLGVGASRIDIDSEGASRALDTRSTDEAWTVNRNSQIQIVGGAARSGASN